MTTETKEISTKEKLLEAAQALMIANGYANTSLDQICSQAEVTKGSFFHYFKNKQELAKTLLELFSSRHHQMMKEMVTDKISDPLDRLFGYIDFARQMTQNPDVKGCLVGTLAQEISESHPELRDVCCGSFKEFTDMIEKDFAESAKLYPPKKSANAHELATFFLAVMQGTMLLAKAQQDRKVFEGNLTHLRQYIESLFQK